MILLAVNQLGDLYGNYVPVLPVRSQMRSQLRYRLPKYSFKCRYAKTKTEALHPERAKSLKIQSFSLKKTISYLQADRLSL